jgi:hypothetical protein
MRRRMARILRLIAAFAAVAGATLLPANTAMAQEIPENDVFAEVWRALTLPR